MKTRILIALSILLFVGGSVMANPPMTANQFLLWASGNYVDGVCQDEYCAYMLWEYNPVNFRLQRLIIDNEFPYDIALEINYVDGEEFVGAWATGHHEVVIPGNIDNFVSFTPTDDVPEIAYIGVRRIAVLSPCYGCSDYVGNVFKLSPSER